MMITNFSVCFHLNLLEYFLLLLLLLFKYGSLDYIYYSDIIYGINNFFSFQNNI